MEQKDFKDYNEYIRACERRCNKIHEAKRIYRIRKVFFNHGPSKFWRWFYGLKKVNEKFCLKDKDGNVKGYYFSEYDAELDKGIDDIIETVKMVDYDLEYSSPYDTLIYKSYLFWVRKVERKGLKLKRPWEDYNIKYWPAEEHNYGKFRALKRLFQHSYHNCIWDASTSYDEIIKLTVAGLYHRLFGHSVEHYEIAHQIWTYRKMLLKSLDFDNWWEYYNVKLKVEEKYKIPYQIEVYNRDGYIENGPASFGKMDNEFNATISPILVESILPRKMRKGLVAETNKDYRKRVLDKIAEIENFVYELKKDMYSDGKMYEEWKKLRLECYQYKTEYEIGWQD